MINKETGERIHAEYIVYRKNDVDKLQNVNNEDRLRNKDNLPDFV